MGCFFNSLVVCYNHSYHLSKQNIVVTKALVREQKPSLLWRKKQNEEQVLSAETSAQFLS